MSRFYASIQGDTNGEATRRGFRGITGHVRGWNTGVEVDGGITDDDSINDSFTVTVTSGSNGARRRFELAEVSETTDGRLRVAVLTADGGRSVFYVSDTGETSTR